MRRREFAVALGALPLAGRALAPAAWEPGAMPLAEADAFIKAEYKRWGEVIRATGITPQ